MTANKVIERVDAIRPNSYSDEQKFGWINKLEEMVQRLVIQSSEIKSLVYPEDMDKELLIPAPFDDLYDLYLESMIDYYNREYGNYNNSALMFETRFTEYKKAYIRGNSVRQPTASGGSGGGTGGTNNNQVVIPSTIHISEEDITKIADAVANKVAIKASSSRIGYIALLASKWVATGSYYSQVVTVEGATENSQVDLTPSVEQLDIFYDKDLAFVTENDNGVVTVYAIGQKPENDYTIQVTITEVAV